MWANNCCRFNLKGYILKSKKRDPGPYTHLLPTFIRRHYVVSSEDGALPAKRGKEYYRNNINKILQQKREYYLRKKGLILKQKLEYYSKNKEHIKRKNRDNYLNNKGLALQQYKIYYNENREIITNKQREYYKNNKEAILNQKRQYYSNNCQALRTQKKLYRLKNKEKIRIRSRKYYLETRQKRNKLARKKRDWSDLSQVRLFFEYASSHLFITHPADWYRISRHQIKDIGGIITKYFLFFFHVSGMYLYRTFGTLGKALQYVYPDMQWEMAKFSLRGKKSTQRWLKILIQQLLPDTAVFEDFLHPELIWDEQANLKMELDIWIPKYNLAIEYQGEHHYYNLHSAYGPSGTVSMYIKRDEQKKAGCIEHGITLATIPYWWDGKRESLASTLYQIRPDIFVKTDCPQIPSQPPTKLLNSTSKWKNHQTSTFLMHGEDWDRSQDPTGWFISEKLDGFRAFWDGSKLYSRTGSPFLAPVEFTHSLPRNVCLDGELWIGYGHFNRLVSILKQSSTSILNAEPHSISKMWEDVKYCIFDAPMSSGNYLERHAFASKVVADCKPFIRVIPVTPCLGFDHLKSTLDEITQKKGEGMMLYHPTAEYTSGRTNHLLKVKEFIEEDVKFLESNPNTYSFLCEQQNGAKAIVKCGGWDYMFPPAPGTVLTVKHTGIFPGSQKMKQAFLLRVRNDLNWNLISN